MSGGRWEYSNNRLLSEMYGYGCDGKHIPNVLEDEELSRLVYDVLVLLGDADYYKSGDTGEETYRERVEEFKKKWLRSSRKDIVKRIVDAKIDELREELYKTFALDVAE